MNAGDIFAAALYTMQREAIERARIRAVILVSLKQRPEPLGNSGNFAHTLLFMYVPSRIILLGIRLRPSITGTGYADPETGNDLEPLPQHQVLVYSPSGRPRDGLQHCSCRLVRSVGQNVCLHQPGDTLMRLSYLAISSSNSNANSPIDDMAVATELLKNTTSLQPASW